MQKVNARRGGIGSAAHVIVNSFFDHEKELFNTDKKCCQFAKDNITSLSFLYEDTNDPKASFRYFYFYVANLPLIDRNSVAFFVLSSSYKHFRPIWMPSRAALLFRTSYQLKITGLTVLLPSPLPQLAPNFILIINNTNYVE
jgi:hypothetical protein